MISSHFDHMPCLLTLMGMSLTIARWRYWPQCAGVGLGHGQTCLAAPKCTLQPDVGSNSRTAVSPTYWPKTFPVLLDLIIQGWVVKVSARASRGDQMSQVSIVFWALTRMNALYLADAENWGSR